MSSLLSLGTETFSRSRIALAPPPKVIILEYCDYPAYLAARLLSDNAVRISELFQSDLALLVLRKP